MTLFEVPRTCFAPQLSRKVANCTWTILCLFAVVANTSPLFAESITLQAVGTAYQAAAGNQQNALILVRLTKADGSPLTDAYTTLAANPEGGVLLCESPSPKTPWCIETLTTPGGFGVFVGRDFLQGQLWVMKVEQAGKGVYRFTLSPSVGLQGGRKYATNWVSGEYTFHLLYNDGSRMGDALATLTIK